MSISGYLLPPNVREQLAGLRLPAEERRIADAIAAGKPLYEMTDDERRQAHNAADERIERVHRILTGEV